MLEISDKQRFDSIATDAIHKAIRNTDRQTAQRWINAIGKAVEMIETQGEFLTYFEKENYLLVWSQTSNRIYSANGVCQCEAYLRNQPCKHRAAARLIRIYFGLAENKSPSFPNGSQAVNPTSLPVSSKETLCAALGGGYRKEEKVGGMRL